MADIVTWENQTCALCDSAQFVQLFYLRAKPGGGVVPVPAGWECHACHHRADLGELQRAALLKQRRKELQALEDEITRSLPATAPPAAPATTPRPA